MTQSTVEFSKAVEIIKEARVRVLHVDDDAGFLKTSRAILEMQGAFQVDTVSSVEEAWEKMKKEEYDAVVSDYQMPGKDGLQFLKELREKGNNIPFIVFTGKGREEVAVKALNLGADRYIDKHGDPETVYCELAHAVSQAVDRMSAQIETLKKEARLDAILESSPEAITVTDLNGNIVECNQATVALHGFESKEDFIGKNALELIARKDHEKAIQNLKRTLEQGSLKTVEYTFLTKDGREFPAELSASVVKDASGKPEHFVSITKDITERKKAERELLIKENAVASAIDGMAIADLEDNVTYVNPAFVKMWGYGSDKEILGKSIAEMTQKGGSKEKADEIVKALRTKGCWAGEITATRKDGSKFYARLSASTVKDEAGKLIFMLSSFVDITERTKAEELVRASEERYRSYVEVTGQLAWTTNANGEVEEDIPTWRKFTGQSPEEVKGWGWTKALHPDDLEHTTQVWEKAVATKSTYEVEYRIRRYDGVYRYFLARGVPVFDEDGSIREWIGTCIDVTERKRAEQGLKESEEKYRNLVELAPDGIVAVNAEGIVTTANRSFLTLVGYDSEEGIVGKPFTELKSIRVEDIPKFQGMFKSLMNGESSSPVEFLYVRKDGMSRWAEVHPRLLTKDGNPVGVQVIMRDVSERKNAEKLVQESQQRFEQLFMSNPEAAVYVDPNERVLNVNPRFTELFGYSLDEVKGKFLDDFVVPEDRKEEGIVLAQKRREGYVYYETVRKNKKGSLIPVTLSSAPIMFQGQHLGGTVLYRDIAERKKVEKERRETMEKVQMMNEKLRVVGSLTRHDVNNKLAAVTGNVYLARKKLPGNSEVLDYLKQIEVSVEQTARIFDFAKAYEMLGVEELAYVDVEKTVDDAVSLFPSLQDVKVMNDCHGLTVLADSLLRQLFYNLIDNSLKYGEKLSCIRVYYEEKNGHLNMIYEDNGAGILQAAKPKLFNEGYTTGKGSGYGLYLIKKMLEVYGWTIQETGEPGKGAKFVVTMPETNSNGKESYVVGC
jgi:PAS domain S-box-containing protein